MRSACTYAQRTCLLHHVGSLSDSAGCVYHVVYDNHVFALNVADNLDGVNNVCTSAGLVAEHERTTEVLSVSVSTLRTANVRRSDNKFVSLQVETLQIRQNNTRSVKVVNRYIKEALNLICMQVHCDKTIDTCSAQKVGYKLSSDANTWLVLTVLASPAEIRNNGDDVACRSALRCVNHKEQLHKIV